MNEISCERRTREKGKGGEKKITRRGDQLLLLKHGVASRENMTK